MNKNLFVAFAMQLELQCYAIVRASKQLEEALAKPGPMEHPDFEEGWRNVNDAWCAVQDMLTAAANVSKVLWGSGGKRSVERKILRDRFQVSEDSPLHDPDMRNNFDHFDERIDTWWATTTTGHNIDRNFTPVLEATDPLFGHVPDTDIFRSLDPETWEVIFWGERYDLRGIVEEAQRLLLALNPVTLFKLPKEFGKGPVADT